VTKRLLYHHTTNTPETVAFNAPEESDGTRRLTELLPAFFTALNEPTVFLLDEIERSMHPTLIRVLLEKYASESKALGQIIYTTHETHLLDQDLLRPDEIWFVEKSQNGETRLHSLNDFKFHHTLDVRKGYLHGRFGAIPSLTSLKNQNWNHHVVES
jgi:AAA15 family ATPase/GTPase